MRFHIHVTDRYASEVPEPVRTVTVMSTYWVAQLLISLCCDVEVANACLIVRLVPTTQKKMRDWSGERAVDVENNKLLIH